MKEVTGNQEGTFVLLVVQSSSGFNEQGDEFVRVLFLFQQKRMMKTMTSVVAIVVLDLLSLLHLQPRIVGGHSSGCSCCCSYTSVRNNDVNAA